MLTTVGDSRCCGSTGSWFAKTTDGKSRRLNVALDTRFYMVGDPYGTVTQISLSLGYDRF